MLGGELMEVVCERQNLKAALRRVKQNRGSPGVDNMTVDELPGYLKEHWPELIETDTGLFGGGDFGEWTDQQASRG
jgi:hypothetical protein